MSRVCSSCVKGCRSAGSYTYPGVRLSGISAEGMASSVVLLELATGGLPVRLEVDFLGGMLWLWSKEEAGDEMRNVERRR